MRRDLVHAQNSKSFHVTFQNWEYFHLRTPRYLSILPIRMCLNQHCFPNGRLHKIGNSARIVKIQNQNPHGFHWPMAGEIPQGSVRVETATTTFKHDDISDPRTLLLCITNSSRGGNVLHLYGNPVPPFLKTLRAEI